MQALDEAVQVHIWAQTLASQTSDTYSPSVPLCLCASVPLCLSVSPSGKPDDDDKGTHLCGGENERSSHQEFKIMHRAQQVLSQL